MGRRRTLTRTSDPAPAGETLPKPPAGRATMRVEVEGDPDTVRKKMGLESEGGAKERETGDDDATFLEALKKAEYRFTVKRVLPREWQGREARIVVFEDACPMLYQDIVDEVTNNSGGKKYRATVFDPSTGKAIAAKTFTVDADPKLPPPREEGATFEDMLNEEHEPDADERLQNFADNQLKMAEKQLNIERTQEMLDTLRKKRDKDKAPPTDDPRIRELEKRLDEERHQRELDRQKAEADRKYDELRAQLAELKANQGKGGEKSDVALALEAMKNMQDEANKRFDRFLTQQREDKLDEIVRKLDKGPAMGGLGTLAEQVKAFRDIKNLLDGGEGDEEEGVDDDREWWEKLIDHVPKIMDKLSDMSKGGKKITKDDFLKEIDEAADRATQEEIRKLQTQQAPPRPALPAPAPAADPSKGSVGRPVTPPEKVTELPPAAPSAPAAPAPAAAAPAAPPPPAQETLAAQLPNAEQQAQAEIIKTAAGIIVMIEIELAQRKRLYQWNYEGAWQNCPETVLEKMCLAADPLAMMDALNVQGLPPELVQKLEGIKAQCSSSPRALRWINLGLKELQRWWQKLEQDPDFDPADEEEEAEEEPAEEPA